MRKHHNKLYYGKYRYKTILDMPQSAMLWPTTDENLNDIKATNNKMDKLWNMADFIINNRHQMKFRIQEKKSIFYTDKALSDKIRSTFIDNFVNTESVDPKHGELKENIVGCDRLPHGKYEYQIHVKKDAHRIITKLQKDNLMNFIERNVDHCFVPGYALMDWLEDRCPYCFGGYFYVTQERYLTPIYMMANEAIEKVIQFRKVKNGSNKKTER